ncbi:DUF11 domain-containing protein [Asanoa sp. WMMD1127]|uniref:DUF11 domain-containing protein n=1 Tax=Asanoa sp. WMMD1127 TaxID=3016107 RepID=UPI0024180BD8|nr:DUF11 domain-containing protein [Asanoa sp. WMMD1127]MDG4823308.1 DUF11 domain-containing protein [Asanoa sp. WMMD1127]
MRWFRLAAASVPLGLVLGLPGIAPAAQPTRRPTASPAPRPEVKLPPGGLPTTAQLTLTAKATPTTVKPGQDATLTITARNAGLLPASDIKVAVPLPAGLAVTGPAGTQGTFDGLLWTVGALPVRRTATLTLKVKGTTAATVTAAAALVSSTPPDGDSRDDLATAAIRVTPPAGARRTRADLTLTAKVTPTMAGPGDPIDYAVTVTNKGPDPATDVEVADPALTGTFLASAVTAGQVTGLPVRTGELATAARWRVGTLAPGTTATWTVRSLATVPARSDPAVLVTRSGADDPTPGDTVGRAAPTVQAADLAITREVSNETPVFGQEVAIILTVRNAGPDLARGVTVTDPPNSGLAFSSASFDAGDYDQETGRWLIGDLAAGGEVTLTLGTRVTAPGQLAGRAGVEGRPADPNSADNVAENVLTASGAAPRPGPLFRTGFPLPYTQIRLSTVEASVVGGLMIVLGLLLLNLRVRTPRAGGAWPAASRGRRSRRPARGRHAAPVRSP